MPFEPNLRAIPAVALPLFALLAGCGRAPQLVHAWPEGTVLALGDVPISAAEIDATADIVARLEPESVPARVRRIALTNVVLPRAAGIHLAGPKRAEARARALECKRLLDQGAALGGPLAGIEKQERVGNFSALGFDAFGYAVDAEIGRWSEPLESVGCFEVVRVEERSQAATPHDLAFKLSAYVIPYVDPNDPHGAIEAELDRSKLEFVDPGWSDIVPEYWKHRLRGGTP